MPLFKNNRGFTLIESIVILSIMAVLALIIFVNYRAYNKRNQLREAAQQVRSAIVEAQNMALAPKDTGTDWYYGLTFDVNSTNYQLYKYRALSPDRTLIKTYTLPNPIRWASDQPSWMGNTLNLFFKPYKAEVYKFSTNSNLPPFYNIPTQPESGTYTLTLNSGNNGINININCATGQTNVNTP